MNPIPSARKQKVVTARRAAGLVLTMVALAGVAAPATAQGPTSEWTFDLGLYGWATAMSGESGAGDVTAELDASFSDILENLEFGAMAGFAATHGRWVVLGDVVFASLGATNEGQHAKAEVDVDMLIFEADLGYEVAQNVQLFGGVRRFDLDNEVVVGLGPLERTAKGGEAWTDPVVGVRWGAPIGERGSFWLRGDVGGFGVGSDFAWNALAAFGYRVGESTTLALGYRVLDVDYEQGSGSDHFVYDIQIGGPELGVIFRF